MNKENIGIGEIVNSMRKEFGADAIMVLGEDEFPTNIQRIPSGSIALDIALGGGYPMGRIVEISGLEGTSKTTTALEAIAQAQKAGGICAFIDVEHALDIHYAITIGVDMRKLMLSQPKSGEEALQIMEKLLKTKKLSMIVLDSVAALVPKAELEGEIGDSHVGLQARLMGQALRKLNPFIDESNCVVIFINQLRSKINAMPFAEPYITSGGHSLKYYASIRMSLKRIGSVKDGEEHVGIQVLANIIKNKTYPPFKAVEIDVIYGKGFSKCGEICDLATEADINVINKSGSWYSYKGQKLAQGRNNMIQYLENNPAMAMEIKQEIFDHLQKKLNKRTEKNNKNNIPED